MGDGSAWPQCSVPTCEKRAKHKGGRRGRGWCSMHTERHRCSGSLDDPTPPAWERLQAKIDTSEGPDSCHPWMGYRSKAGYGRFTPNGVGSSTLAARWMLGQLRGKPLTAGEEACHHCDNPPCMNRRHLYVGTRRDNARDAEVRGRMHHPYALSPAAVAAIRRRYAAGGVTQCALAKEYGVSQATISVAISGRVRARRASVAP